MRVKCLFQDTTQCPRTGLKPGPLDQESSALNHNGHRTSVRPRIADKQLSAILDLSSIITINNVVLPSIPAVPPPPPQAIARNLITVFYLGVGHLKFLAAFVFG